MLNGVVAFTGVASVSAGELKPNGKFHSPALIASNGKGGESWVVDWAKMEPSGDLVRHMQLYHDKRLAKAVAAALIQMPDIDEVKVFQNG